MTDDVEISYPFDAPTCDRCGEELELDVETWTCPRCDADDQAALLTEMDACLVCLNTNGIQPGESRCLDCEWRESLNAGDCPNCRSPLTIEDGMWACEKCGWCEGIEICPACGSQLTHEATSLVCPECGHEECQRGGN